MTKSTEGGTAVLFRRMTLQERIDNYVKETGFPRSIFLCDDKWIVGSWLMGQNYTVKSGYYGGFPAGFLKRVKAMFPDKISVLHLFSGMVDLNQMPGDTVDINPTRTPTYADNAETMASVPLEKYDLVVADPPYSESDALRYGVCLVNRNRVMSQLGSRLSPGAHVVWLDQVLPMYSKKNFAVDGFIGLVKSTNHRFRVLTIFRKLAECEPIGRGWGDDGDDGIHDALRRGGRRTAQTLFHELPEISGAASGPV